MSDDVRRVRIEDQWHDDVWGGQVADVVEDDEPTHALIPWEDYERLRELEDAIIVTVGGIDVNLLDVIKKHRATIEELSSRLSEVVDE